MATVESLNQEIAERTAAWNDAKKSGADPSVVEEHRVKLGELKKALGQLMASNRAKDGKEDKKRERLLLKTAKVCTVLLSLSV